MLIADQFKLKIIAGCCGEVKELNTSDIPFTFTKLLHNDYNQS